MTALMTVLGIVVFVLGLLFSIAWHELGHLSTAKLFGIRVPQYMVGFGPTIFSRRKGETEYGIKAIPLGGYIRMIGMFPPGEDGKVQQRSTSPFRSMIEDARSAAYEELRPGDEKRLFYTRKPWKRVIVMFAGPFMNLVLAVAIFLGVLLTFGINTTTTTVSSVSQCVVAADAKDDTCPKDAPATPANAAGLRPGDEIVGYDGQEVAGWQELQRLIRDASGEVTITVERDGERQTLTAEPIRNKVTKIDDDGQYVPGEYVTANFLGFTPARGVVQQSFPQAVDRMGQMMEDGAEALVAVPSKVPGLWDAAFNGGERAQDSPVGVIGAARVSGEIVALDIPASQRVAVFLFVVAAFNLSLFLFNMLPLLPLDGGHIAGALWESVRRFLARVLRRPDPGPFDVAKLMPVAYVVASIFICFTLLVLVADVVNPVRLTG
ncbi:MULTISPECIES: M50 family metallopeptidase [unclassified Streptomyces]|uniref:M50 family metallopeptidase n=1 Tax=unclassified Streptomyces TaxID=2593676 RepID=UPI0022B69236|nr:MULTISPECIES: site-2 protease family protein [unclassified Streptomyces]MCZ7416232.1 site-2 protease family protein [Streptomyces sp. WMMC897]MCZ7433959.1 site-2 protease family protein [Streptomyces sp. WMMC1477]